MNENTAIRGRVSAIVFPDTRLEVEEVTRVSRQLNAKWREVLSICIGLHRDLRRKPVRHPVIRPTSRSRSNTSCKCGSSFICVQGVMALLRASVCRFIVVRHSPSECRVKSRIEDQKREPSECVGSVVIGIPVHKPAEQIANGQAIAGGIMKAVEPHAA